MSSWFFEKSIKFFFNLFNQFSGRDNLNNKKYNDKKESIVFRLNIFKLSIKIELKIFNNLFSILKIEYFKFNIQFN